MDYAYGAAAPALPITKEQASDEDTEDASEAECEKKEEEFTGIKEQMYQDKLSHLRHQKEQLKEGTLPQYTKKLKKLSQANSDRVHATKVWLDRQLQIIQDQYEKEKAAANKEFEEKKAELMESLIQELEQKKKAIENERNVMELAGDTMAVKPVTTRKLRRRPNDPVPVLEKKGKPSPVQLTTGLDESAINDDVYLINRLTGKLATSKTSATAAPSTASSLSHGGGQHGLIDSHEVAIRDGQLLCDKKLFTKDQTVILESRDHVKTNATIVSFTADEILLKKIADNCRIRISIAQLQTGYYTLRKRTNS